MTSSLSIPPQFQEEGFRFVKLGGSGEGLKKPFEYFWDCLTLEEARRQYADDLAAAGGDKSKSKRLQAGEPSRLTNYAFDDPIILQHLARGRNYGIVNGSGPNGAGLATLDADNLPRLAEMVDFSLLPPTLEAGRRGEDGEPIPERRHFHFISDLEGKHLLKDPDTGEDLGDLRGTGGFQVVGPGSLHPSGARVEVLEDRPIATIDGAELLEVLKPVLETSSPSKLETDRARLEGLKGKRRPPTATDDPFEGVSILDVINTSGFKESGGQLFGSNPVHGSDTGHNLVVNPAKNSWWCGRHDAGGGPALWLAVEAEIIDCSEATAGSLRGEKYLQVLDYARKRGIIPDDDRRTDEGEARELLKVLETKLAEDPEGWAQDPDVKRALAALRKRDAVGAVALLKRAGVRGALKAALLTDLKRIDSDEGDDEKGGRGPSMATRIVDLALASGAEFWKSPEGEPFATTPNGGGHIENHPLKSKAVKTWLSGLLFKAEGKAPKGSAVADALAVLEGRAIFEGETFPVFVRLAEYGGRFYLDLGGDDWRAVEIGPDGWRVIPSEAVPVKFRRSKGILELPEPKSGGNLEILRRVLNIPEGAPWVLVRAWLVQAFKPTGPYPVLIVDGEQGSGKSWLGRILRYMVDPNKAALRRPPRNEHELMIGATNSWLVAYDNLSGLPPWLGDALCVVSTGGGMSTRELYTDSEEALFDIQRPIILNGIDALTTRGDLLGRAILLHLPRIEDGARRTETAIKVELERIRPGVLGAILDVISHGLRALPGVKLESMPRMADFAEWVTACEGALGWERGEFLEAFEENQNESKVALIENDMFAVSLVEFINGLPGPEKGITDTAGGLLSILNTRSNITGGNMPAGWPKTAKGTGNKLRRLIPALRAAGIEVEFLDRAHGGVRKIKIGRCGDDCKNDNVTTKPEGSDPDGQQKREEKRPIVTIVTKKPASGDDGDDGDDGFLTSTLDEDIEKRERGGREGGKIEGGEREGKVTKSPSPPSPSSPDAGFLVTIGDDGDDSEELAGEIPDPDDYQSIAENLEEDKRRKAEIAERVKTPEEDRLPTAEESEVLEDLAGRLLQNWPGLPEMLLWEKARGKLGSRLPLGVVRSWLRASGYIKTGEKYGGGVIWNLPASGGVVG
ncbi:MAG: hypothetical protein PHX71_09825 [Synergistales bacterium]|nr:hypothetical protein [Synergistales bacterium]